MYYYILPVMQYGDFDPDLYQPGFLANEKILPQKVSLLFTLKHGMNKLDNVTCTQILSTENCIMGIVLVS